MKIRKISSFFIVDYKGYRISVQQVPGGWAATFRNDVVIAETIRKAVKLVIENRLTATV